MISDLYGGIILEAAANLPPASRLDSPDASATRVSRVCGSSLTLDLMVEDGVVTDFGLDSKACALGQAAASLTAENLIGATVGELYRLRDVMVAMLKDNGPPPSDERWQRLAALQAIQDYPQRHASTLLIFEAIVECLNGLADGRPSSGDAR